MDRQAEQVDSTAVVGIPVVHTAAVDRAVGGMMAGGHTAAEAGTVDNHGAVVMVGRQPLVVEDKCAEAGESRAGESRTAWDRERGLEMAAVHIQRHTAAAGLKLHKQNILKQAATELVARVCITAAAAQALVFKHTSVGWQVTLCDPIWHVSSRSGVAGQTANCYIGILYFTTLPASLCTIKFPYTFQCAMDQQTPQYCPFQWGRG